MNVQLLLIIFIGKDYVKTQEERNNGWRRTRDHKEMSSILADQ
jgi:hypothetical protein